MVERLTSLDASFLYLEEPDTPHARRRRARSSSRRPAVSMRSRP